MEEEHDLMLKKWLQTCSWSKIGSLRKLFCTSKNNVCFSCWLYLKPIIREETVNMIGYFIKDNDQDYLLMTDKNVIIAAGSSFTELLGPNIINVPLSILVEDRKQLTNILNTINTPTTRSSNHSLNFYSTTSKNSQ